MISTNSNVFNEIDVNSAVKGLNTSRPVINKNFDFDEIEKLGEIRQNPNFATFKRSGLKRPTKI